MRMEKENPYGTGGAIHPAIVWRLVIWRVTIITDMRKI